MTKSVESWMMDIRRVLTENPIKGPLSPVEFTRFTVPRFKKESVMDLYQYAVLLDPTKEEKEAGVKSAVVVSPGDWVLASNEKEVILIAARHPALADHMEHADRLRVIVRPF